MRTITGAAVLALVIAPGAGAATTGDVYWSLRGENARPLNAIDPSVDPYLYVTTSVRVTGENQGLAGFMFSYGVRDLSLPTDPGYLQNWAKHPIPNGSSSWSEVYACPPGGTVATIKDNGVGPGMSILPSLGWPHPSVAYLDQVGASYLAWKARRYRTSPEPAGWVGDCTWGVGLDGRKSVILADPNGLYDVNVLVLDLTDWHPGDYVVDMPATRDPWGVPYMAGSVLRSDIDLNVDQTVSVIWQLGLSNLHGDALAFTIVPEPGTLLLLAALGGLARRRR